MTEETNGPDDFTRLADQWRALLNETTECARTLENPESRKSLQRALTGAGVSESFARYLTAAAAAGRQSRIYEAPQGERRPVVIVGGAGGMGRILRDHFERTQLEVRVLEKDDWPRASEILAGAGTVVVSVPIDVTVGVIERLAPFLTEEMLLTDVTSVKRAPVEAMLKAHRGPVAGLHPMFGPDVVHFDGQVFAFVPAREPGKSLWLRKAILDWGAKVVECTAEEHDRSMAIIQAMRHFTTYAYGVFLSKVNPNLSKILELSSPIYRLEIEMVGRLFAQDPHLYADIILSSQENAGLIERYVEGLAPELELIRARDRDGFVKRFLEARAWFGPMAETFLKESGRLLALVQAERGR